jgi:hypothetical protein
MRKHRRTPDTVSNNAEPDNFRATDALESLHAAILRVETIAQVANDAVENLHCALSPAARRAFARMQILANKAAEEASGALAEGDKLMAALTNHLQAGQSKRDLGSPPAG